jgi:hypothetical protein
MTPFEIKYAIPEAEWEKAKGCRWQPDAQPIFDFFHGDVWIECNGASLLGPPYNMSVADLACGLATMLRRGFPHELPNACFGQSDDALEIHFTANDHFVALSADNRVLRVRDKEFVEGALAFVAGFAEAASERVPDALAWRDLEVLAAFIRVQRERS